MFLSVYSLFDFNRGRGIYIIHFLFYILYLSLSLVLNLPEKMLWIVRNDDDKQNKLHALGQLELWAESIRSFYKKYEFPISL